MLGLQTNRVQGYSFMVQEPNHAILGKKVFHSGFLQGNKTLNGYLVVFFEHYHHTTYSKQKPFIQVL